MAEHVKVPKFGEWETEGNVPYTVVFDKARNKTNGLKMINTNPQQNPNMFPDNVSPAQATPLQTETKSGEQNGRDAVMTKHVHSSSREDGDLRRLSGSPQHHGTVNLKVSPDLTLHWHGSLNSAGTPKRAARQNAGSECRIEHSPLHPHHQAKVGGKGGGMTSLDWERKGSTERGNNLSPFTTGRSRLRSVTQSAETPDHSSAVPKFGEWDESDPTSADGYTDVFNKVREEKLNGTGNVSAAAFRKPYSQYQKQHENEMSKKWCCFPC